jgi:hypothetical protein
MAHAIHADDYSPEEALRVIKAERTRRGWVALILFVLCGALTATAFYLSYRDLPAPATPANGSMLLPDPYH